MSMRAVVPPHDRRLLAQAALGHVADHRLEHVLDRHHALDLAVLVDHQRHAHPRLAQRLQRARHRHRVRHDQHRPQRGLQVERPAGEAGVEQAAHVDHAQHIVQAALADHEAAVPALADDPGDLVRPGLDIEPDQLDAGAS